MSSVSICPITSLDEETVADLIEQHWGDRKVVLRGKVLDAALLPGFLATEDANVVGLITLHVEGTACEIVTLDAFVPGKGIGKALVSAAESFARAHGCKRMWLITSNDNVGALTFYQKVGLRIIAVHIDAIVEARKLKPLIPLVAESGIPIRDEIELEKIL